MVCICTCNSNGCVYVCTCNTNGCVSITKRVYRFTSRPMASGSCSIFITTVNKSSWISVELVRISSYILVPLSSYIVPRIAGGLLHCSNWKSVSSLLNARHLIVSHSGVTLHFASLWPLAAITICLIASHVSSDTTGIPGSDVGSGLGSVIGRQSAKSRITWLLGVIVSKKSARRRLTYDEISKWAYVK